MTIPIMIICMLVAGVCLILGDIALLSCVEKGLVGKSTAKKIVVGSIIIYIASFVLLILILESTPQI